MLCSSFQTLTCKQVCQRRESISQEVEQEKPANSDGDEVGGGEKTEMGRMPSSGGARL